MSTSSASSASDNNRGNGGQKKKRGRGGSYGNQNKNKKTKSEEVGGRKVASADEVTLEAIIDSAERFVKLRTEHTLNDKRRAKPSQVCWSYHDPITDDNPELITEEGCRLILRMGKDIPNFNPINPSAVIHYLDNHDCPNGLMPVLALVLMELSEYELSFQEAHKIICAFAREQKKKNRETGTFEGIKGQASLHWLHLSNWSKNKDTMEEIFEGTYTKMTFP